MIRDCALFWRRCSIVYDLPAAGQFGDPPFQFQLLLVRKFIERDSHTEASLRIDHGSFGLEIRRTFSNSNFDLGSNRERGENIDEAASRAQIARTRGKTGP